MNYPLIQRILGTMLILFSVALIIPIITSLIFNDGNISVFITSFILFFISGSILYFPNMNSQNDIKAKDGFLLVVLFWVVLSAFGSVPFMLDQQLSLSFADAFFESISGWTTTGATVIKDIDGLSLSILIYRQELQWLGGMGIVILALAVLPMLGVGGMQLYNAETTGPIKDKKISPRIAETAKHLWAVYLGLTVLCALSYFIAGMSAFDAISHSFSTIAIGGFSTHNDSIGYFQSSSIEFVCIIFMFLSALNFTLHFIFLRSKNIKSYFMDAEARLYLFIIFTFISIMFLYLITSNTLETEFRHIIFQGVSFITTSGFTSTSYAGWPSFLLITLLTMSFVGACTGSTGGGMKVMRIMLLFKLMKKELMKILHPTAEIPIIVNENPLSENISHSVWNFFILYIISYLVISFLLLASGLDMTSAFSAVASCINNLGPALGAVSDNYSAINDFSKYMLSFAMLLGRLEIFTLLIVMTPYFWKY
ncbi:MAG: potassium transporter [Pelagibacterales bacterium]|nr:potassium transporter [Pelagibacterales bacterium]|tara:strand:+ start:370 stop:1812 length:1443 start_codon:yes stop_codon:yes gene_type:complete